MNDRTEHTPALDRHLHAYNGAFWDLGFKWQWDAAECAAIAGAEDEKLRLRAYVERHQPHLLKAYDIDFLIGLIHENKTRRLQAMAVADASGGRVELSCNGLRG
jgi:hypothetical protein